MVYLAGLKDELNADIYRVIHQSLVVRDGLNVPSNLAIIPEGGLRYDATLLCADLSQSGKMVSDFDQRTAAKVARAFLRSTCRLITTNGGSVISLDSSRVIGIFLGDMRNTNAATCALKINYAVSKIIKPTLTQYFTISKEPGFNIAHCVGIDTGSVIATRAGLIGSHDLIWVGKALQLAIKLSEIRTEPYHAYISETVFFMLFEQAKFSADGNQLMWEESRIDYQGDSIKVYRSGWWREP